MVKEARVDRSFSVRETQNETVVSVGRAARWRLVIGTLVMVFAGLPAMLLSMFGIFTFFALPEMRSRVWEVFALAAAGGCVAWGAYRFASLKTTMNIAIHNDGIVFAGKKYRWENISFVGYENAAGGTVQTFDSGTISGSAGLVGAQMVHQFGYFTYIVHGTRKVVVVRGLQENEVEGVYRELTGAFARRGYSFH